MGVEAGRERPERLILGRVTGLYGVRGWVKVYSYTDPRGNILRYNPWQLRLGGGWRKTEVQGGRLHGKGVIAKLEGCDDRDAAAGLMGAEIAIERTQLEPLEAGEYYWADLIGLTVINEDGLRLGVVDHLFETGANDVLVVRGERERLIPYALGETVTAVDLERGELHVRWDPEF